MPLNLKQDRDFLRYLTMGAAGSEAVARDLNEHWGHRVAELERYTTSNKIWATKIKRLRLPDLFCLNCGLRVEARAKSKLEIKVSDSESGDPGRAWDVGLRGDDLFAFVRWDRSSERVASKPWYFSVGALRAVDSFSKEGRRKSVADGSEFDRSWPVSVPAYGGVVEALGDDERSVRVKLDNGRRQTYRVSRGVADDHSAHVYVGPGQRFEADNAMLIGFVAAPSAMRCSGGWDPRTELGDRDPVARYTAVKACGLLKLNGATERLLAIAGSDEDERIALESWASLARMEPDEYTGKVADHARGANRALAMESTFVLAELGTTAAGDALSALALGGDSELRAAALWGLGESGLGRYDTVISHIADADDSVALHAVAALGRLDDGLLKELANHLAGNDREASSATAILADQGDRGLRLLSTVAVDGDRGARWALVGLGGAGRDAVLAAVPTLAGSVLDVLEPMWLSAESWLADADAQAPVDFLRRQKIRHVI